MKIWWSLTAVALVAMSAMPASATTLDPTEVGSTGAVTPLTLLTEPTPWYVPGTNPCRQSAGCTPFWAVEEMRDSGALPEAVAHQITVQETAWQFQNIENPEYRFSFDPDVAARARQPHAVEVGDTIVANSFATRPQDRPRMQYGMVAAFRDGKSRAAKGHIIEHDGVTYYFLLVAECGNWILLTDEPRRQTIPPSVVWSSPDTFCDCRSGNRYGAGVGGGSRNFGLVSIGGGGHGVGDRETDVPGHYEDPLTPVDNTAVIPLPASFWALFAALGWFAGLRWWKKQIVEKQKEVSV